MNYSNHRILLDIHDTASQVSIFVKKGDNNRRICAVLTENGKPYKIADGVTAVFRAKKPADSNGNRAIVFNDIHKDDITENTICYTLVGDNTNVAGVADCEFTLYGMNGKVLTSPRFTLVIENTVNTDDEVEVVGKDEVTALTALIAETTALKDEIETKRDNGDFLGERGPQGEKGEKGDQGPAPVKGVDYFTDTDKGEMLNELATPFANAIKGTAHGKEVTIYDASPVEHTVKLRVNGKNLADSDLFSVWFDKQADGSYLSNTEVPADKVSLALPEGVYTLSMMLKSPKDKNYRPVIVYADDTIEAFFKMSTGEYVQHTGATNGKAIKAVYLDYSGRSDTVQFKNFQIEKGRTATEYEPYIDPTTVTVTEETTGATYTPNADGTCAVVSVSPTMTLMTDNADVYIECEYNRDLGAVFADIVSRMDELLNSAVSRISYIDLPASEWKGTESPYSQVVDLYGITEYSKVDINPSVDQLDVFHDKDIAFVTENDGGVITVYCVGQKPADDYYMQVSITEVMSID